MNNYYDTWEPVTCEWFAMCDNQTEIAVDHRAFDNPVPICARCAEAVEMKDYPA